MHQNERYAEDLRTYSADIAVALEGIRETTRGIEEATYELDFDQVEQYIRERGADETARFLAQFDAEAVREALSDADELPSFDREDTLRQLHEIRQLADELTTIGSTSLEDVEREVTSVASEIESHAATLLYELDN